MKVPFSTAHFVLWSMLTGCGFWDGYVQSCFADEYFVWTNSPVNGPGTNWATAFHSIQAGIDAAIAGDTVWVTNGTFNIGGRMGDLGLGHTLTNRIVVDKAIIVRSASGPGQHAGARRTHGWQFYAPFRAGKGNENHHITAGQRLAKGRKKDGWKRRNCGLSWRMIIVCCVRD